MLDEGRKRAEADQMSEQLDQLAGDAMARPFLMPVLMFIQSALALERHAATRCTKRGIRVLRPGGRLMVLEFFKFPMQHCNGPMTGIRLTLSRNGAVDCQ